MHFRSIGLLIVLLLTGLGLSLGLRSSSRSASSEVTAAALESALVSDKGPGPQRILLGAPSVCEIVFALGCGDRVLGVSDFCSYPPGVKTRTRIGGWVNPNRERILALKPDILITQGKHESLATLCGDEGIEFFTVEIETLADIRQAILAIGQRLNVPGAARREVARLDAGLGAVRKRVLGRAMPKVFLSISRQPGTLSGLMTPGPETFLNELLAVAGGSNVFADARGRWPQVSKESLLVRAPEVILEAAPEGLTPERR